MSGGEGTSCQHLDLLGMANFGMSIDYFLSCLLQLLGQLSKLQNFSFNKWVAQHL
jgi:hypothetical protein